MARALAAPDLDRQELPKHELEDAWAPSEVALGRVRARQAGCPPGSVAFDTEVKRAVLQCCVGSLRLLSSWGTRQVLEPREARRF